MSWTRFFRRRYWDEERARELDAYLEAETDENIARGMSPEEARYAAHRKLGNTTLIREEIYHMNSLGWIETLWQDLRFALRMLRKNPGFTTVVVLTLALGIGATTSIFTVVNGVLLRPLPYPHPEELVYVQEILNNFPVEPFAGSNEFAVWRKRSRALSQVAAYMNTWVNLTGEGEPERVTSGMASCSFFSLLGVRPLAGRLFLSEEDRPGGPPVVLLSEALWRGRYKADPSIIGKEITLDGKLYSVVGVLPNAFVIPDQVKTDYALWVPLAEGEPGTGRNRVVRIIGRLKPGVSLEAARAEMDAIVQPMLRRGLKERIVLSFWHDQITRSSRVSLLLLLSAVGFLLLIACVNVANLMLSRAASRQKEMVVRLTVGAGRPRIVRQLLTESTVLALAGGLLGLVLAQWGKGLLISFISPDLPRLEPIALDYRVLAFSFALAVATGLAFGLAPALQASKASLNEALKEAARSTPEIRSGRLFRNLLIVSETALAMVLLAGGGLLYRSFQRARGIDPGFHSDGVLTLTIDLTPGKYPTAKDQARFFEEVIEDIKDIHGVQSVGGSAFPLTGERHGVVTGGVVEAGSEDMLVAFDAVSPDFFRTMHIPLMTGRYFDDGDREASSSVAVVNDSLARHYFPGESCLGKKIHSWIHRKDMLTIVGVVGNVRIRWERDPAPEIYIPYQQGPQPFMVLFVRTAGKPTHLAAAIRSQIAHADKDQPPHDIATLEELRAQSLTPRRVNMLLFGAFAALGLILASVGIYGVVSYSVSQRTHEIGMRMALGAERSDVLMVVIWQGLRSVLIGTVIGVAASLAVTRLLGTMLFGVKPTDPVTFIVVSLTLVGVALLATYVPARRATKVDPMVALRHE